MATPLILLTSFRRPMGGELQTCSSGRLSLSSPMIRKLYNTLIIGIEHGLVLGILPKLVTCPRLFGRSLPMECLERKNQGYSHARSPNKVEYSAIEVQTFAHQSPTFGKRITNIRAWSPNIRETNYLGSSKDCKLCSKNSYALTWELI